MARIEAVQGPGGAFLPLIPIEVVVQRTRKLTVTALVDSGADRSIVPRALVEALNVDYDRLPEAKNDAGEAIPGIGVGGGFDIKECRGRLRWRNWNFCDSFWVAPDGIPYALVGRDDFFATFEVRFLWNEDPPIMEIEKL